MAAFQKRGTSLSSDKEVMYSCSFPGLHGGIDRRLTEKGWPCAIETYTCNPFTMLIPRSFGQRCTSSRLRPPSVANASLCSMSVSSSNARSA
eukprot:scaffold870_cov268-Pinguiococcus_pyrenoidosus.AAC.5